MEFFIFPKPGFIPAQEAQFFTDQERVVLLIIGMPVFDQFYGFQKGDLIVGSMVGDDLGKRIVSDLVNSILF